MANAPDNEAVPMAIRLGWTLAEVRGRNRPNAPLEAAGYGIRRTGHALPLSPERTAHEQEIASEAALEYLATSLEVNTEVAAEAGGTTLDPYSKQVRSLTKELAKERKAVQDDAGTWDRLAELLYRWDAAIQDALWAKSAPQASAYQLGRGLSEAFWNLEPTQQDDDDPTSWSFLLGSRRRPTLSRLIGRLSGYFDPLTAPAIEGSIMVWSDVAQDPKWRSQPARLRCFAIKSAGGMSFLFSARTPRRLSRHTHCSRTTESSSRPSVSIGSSS